jgi:pimeloyl-ACP methyl ester carboxylesterase
MRAALARLTALFASLLLLCATVACAEHAVAPARDEPTPPDDTENVSVVISGDVILNGRLFGGDNKPTVILTHMRQNDQTVWFPYAEQLVQHGYAALTFDFRGYGMSTGNQDYDKLDEDLSAVIQYMVTGRKRNEIYLVGASMGATTALVVAGANNVKAVVAVSPPAKFESQDALATVPGLHASKLFIASELDAPALQFDELYGAAAEPKEKELYPGKLHGTDLLDPVKNDQAAAVGARIIKFLDEQR